MFALLFATFVAAVALLSLRIPSVWLSLIAHDEAMDAHELGLALVATRMSSDFSPLLSSPYPPSAHQGIHSAKAGLQPVWQSL